jgi:hypothetical protein
MHTRRKVMPTAAPRNCQKSWVFRRCKFGWLVTKRRAPVFHQFCAAFHALTAAVCMQLCCALTSCVPQSSEGGEVAVAAPVEPAPRPAPAPPTIFYTVENLRALRVGSPSWPAAMVPFQLTTRKGVAGGSAGHVPASRPTGRTPGYGDKAAAAAPSASTWSVADMHALQGAWIVAVPPRTGACVCSPGPCCSQRWLPVFNFISSPWSCGCGPSVCVRASVEPAQSLCHAVVPQLCLCTIVTVVLCHCAAATPVRVCRDKDAGSGSKARSSTAAPSSGAGKAPAAVHASAEPSWRTAQPKPDHMSSSSSSRQGGASNGNGGRRDDGDLWDMPTEAGACVRCSGRLAHAPQVPASSCHR